MAHDDTLSTSKEKTSRWTRTTRNQRLRHRREPLAGRLERFGAFVVVLFTALALTFAMAPPPTEATPPQAAFAEGDIYVLSSAGVQQGGGIYRVDPGTFALSTLVLEAGLSSLAFAPDDSSLLAASPTPQNPAVFAYSPAGSRTTLLRLVPPLNGQPGPMAYDHVGDLFVAVSGPRILRFPAGGGDGSVFVDTGVVGGPYELAFAANGDLLVADGGFRILRIDPAGNATVFDTYISTGDGQPTSIDVRDNGDIYVATLSPQNPGRVFRYVGGAGPRVLLATVPAGAGLPAALKLNLDGSILYFTSSVPVAPLPNPSGNFVTIDPDTGVWNEVIPPGTLPNHMASIAIVGENRVPPPNSAPTADAGVAVSVECSGPGGNQVTLNGLLSSDPDDDPLTFNWSGPFAEGGGMVGGEMPTVTLPLGIHTITLTVMDTLGLTGIDNVQITVMDTTAPAFTMVPGPIIEEETGSLTPVDVPLALATDICDSSLSVSDDAPTVFPLGTTTVTFVATDASGNTATATTTVTVAPMLSTSITLLGQHVDELVAEGLVPPVAGRSLTRLLDDARQSLEDGQRGRAAVNLGLFIATVRILAWFERIPPDVAVELVASGAGILQQVLQQ